MSCLTTSASRRSRLGPAAVLTASAAASSHEVPLVPMTSITLYTLMTISLDDLPSQEPRRSGGPPPWLGLAGTASAARLEPGTQPGRRPGPLRCVPPPALLSRTAPSHHHSTLPPKPGLLPS